MLSPLVLRITRLKAFSMQTASISHIYVPTVTVSFKQSMKSKPILVPLISIGVLLKNIILQIKVMIRNSLSIPRRVDNEKIRI